MIENSSYLVFSGTKTRYLAEKICASLGCPLGKLMVTKFSDGEFAVSYEESIRGRDIFLVQSTFPNSDNLMELLLMIDAAKRASARTINAVIPYFGWARQDRKDKPRVSIGATLAWTICVWHRQTWVARSAPTLMPSILAARLCSAIKRVHAQTWSDLCKSLAMLKERTLLSSMTW